MTTSAILENDLLESQFVEKILNDIESNQLVLPTLPEIGLRVRKLVDDPDITALKLSRVISADGAVSARLLQVANSVSYAGREPVIELRSAVSRLGHAQVRSLVTSLVMAQIFNLKKLDPAIQNKIKKLWIDCTKIGALSQVLAKNFTRIKPDEAMLAGLTHLIGWLPVLSCANDFPQFVGDAKALKRVCHSTGKQVSEAIMEAWKFPDAFKTVVTEFDHLDREGESPKIELVDIVIVARLHHAIGTPNHPYAKLDWMTLTPFKKFGLEPEESIRAINEAKQEISQLQSLLIGA